MVHFFFEVPTSPAATLELDEELDDEDVLELELEESEKSRPQGDPIRADQDGWGDALE